MWGDQHSSHRELSCMSACKIFLAVELLLWVKALYSRTAARNAILDGINYGKGDTLARRAVSLLYQEKEELVRIWRVTSCPLLQTKTLRVTGFFKSTSTSEMFGPLKCRRKKEKEKLGKQQKKLLTSM